MESGFRFVEAVGHMANHALEPVPQILSSFLQRLPHVHIDLPSNARLFLGRHGNAEVVSAGDGQHLQLQAELLAQSVRRWVVLLAKEAIEFGPYVLDVSGVEIEEVLYLLREALLKFTHASRELEIKMR